MTDYFFRAGDSYTTSIGNYDAVYESTSAGSDRIILSGINAADVHTWTDSYGSFYIQYTASDLISIAGGLDGFSAINISAYVEEIVFAGNVTWDLTQGLVINDPGQDYLYGSSQNDTFYGNGGQNTIYGYGGSDLIVAADNGNFIFGGSGVDTLSYEEAVSGVEVDLFDTSWQDTLGAGMNYITGVENLVGSGYADTLTGDSSSNILSGGVGSDTLYGGAGEDVFEFAFEGAFSSVDEVGDFDVSTDDDKVDLSDLLGIYDPLTHAITDFVQITTSGSNSAVFVDRDGLSGTYGFDQIATLVNVTGLTDEAALVASGNLVVA